MTYCCHHLNNSTRDGIRKVVLNFYTPEEIRDAKNDLWSAYGENTLGKFVRRRDQPQNPAHEKATDDILSAMYKLDLNDSVTNVSFAARNLDRLPKYGPEELDLTSMVMRVMQLEQKHESLERKVAMNVENISTMMDAQLHVQQVCYSEVARQPVRHATPGDKVPRVQPQGIPTPQSGSTERSSLVANRQTPSPTGSAAGLNVNPPAAKPSSAPASAPPGPPAPQQGNARPEPRHVGEDRIDDSGFQVPRYQRRRDQRSNKTRVTPVFGSGNTSTLKAGRQTRELFVFNLDRETTEEEVKIFLANNNIETTEIDCRSNEEARTKSFRVVVYSSDIDNIMKADLWPPWVGIRPYFRKRSNGRNTNHDQISRL